MKGKKIVKLSLKEKLAELPRTPGVYLMKDASGKILYIGKAKVLRNRVRSYFSAKVDLDPKTTALKAKIADLEVLITDNEVEALILEANLIKKHRPRYNVNLKDDKRFPYLKLTQDDDFPRLIVTRSMRRDNGIYFGPYANAGAMRRTYRMLTKVFSLRTCNFKIPHPKERKYKLCLQYHIKRCPGPCVDLISKNEYDKGIKKVIKFLEGKTTGLLEELNEEMGQFAKSREYEEAAKVRDQIQAIEAMAQKQKVTTDHIVDRDIIAFARSDDDLSVVVLQIREGLLIGRQNLYLRTGGNESDSEIASSFIKQYYLNASMIPEEIYCSIGATEEVLIKKWLSGKRKGKLTLLFPQRGKKYKLVEMAIANARLLLAELLEQKRDRKTKLPKTIEILQKELYLQKPPITISAFDISNFGECEPVGSMVFFRNGKPVKKNYRHFKIKTVSGQNDFAMMSEVVRRYFTRSLTGEVETPDLCLIDGGRGQLNAALVALDELGINDQQICGLAKRLDEVVLPQEKKMLSLAKTSPSLKLLQKVRDEAHRFAITYHKKLRDKQSTKSILDEIPGVGIKRKELLLKEFESLEEISNADYSKLEDVLKNKKIAKTVFQYLSKKTTSSD